MQLTRHFKLDDFENADMDKAKYIAEQLEFIKNSYKQPFSFQYVNDLTIQINLGSYTRNHNFFILMRKMIKVGLPIEELIEENDYSQIYLVFAPPDNQPSFLIKHIK